MKKLFTAILIMATVYAMPQSQRHFSDQIISDYETKMHASQIRRDKITEQIEIIKSKIDEANRRTKEHFEDGFNWNYPNYNPYYFGCASIHVTDHVGIYDSLFYDVQIGDKIGFFDSEGLCCGYNTVMDTINNTGVSLVGDDPSTNWKEGFYEGDSMYLKIYSFSLRQDFDCDFVSYMTPEEDSTILPGFYYWDGLFHNTGLYVIDTLTAYVPLEKHYISITEGWGGISSYLIPVNRNVEVMFEGVPLVVLKNGGQSYMPGYHNTIGFWQPDKGYQINVSEDCIVEITGLEIMDKTLELQAGWHIIPVLSDIPVYCGFDLTDEYDLIQSFSTSLYWPYQNIYTLEYLEPGKAYKVHLDNPFTFDFEQEYFIGIKEIKERKSKKAIFHEGKIYINGYDLNGKAL